jgi:hypothetical protein
MMREVERFKAIGDSGRTYAVVVRQWINTGRTLSGQSQAGPGSKDFILDNGAHVNPTDDPDAFVIPETNEIIHRIR